MIVREILLKLWNIFDPVYCSIRGLEPITAKSEDETVFRTRLIRYKGDKTILSDGTTINKNDLLVKIHLYNVKLLRNHLQIKNELVKGREMYKKAKQSMPLLAEYIKNHPQESEIKGIIGITMINKGVRSLGFECVTPSNKLYYYFKKISQMPIYLLSWSNISLKKLKKSKPVYLMMSKAQMYETYNQIPKNNRN